MNTTAKKSAKPNLIKNFLLATLTLGLAPWGIMGEPHIIGKVRWVMGGAVGMQAIDWFDLVLHGTPWVLLIGAILWEGKKRLLPTKQ